MFVCVSFFWKLLFRQRQKKRFQFDELCHLLYMSLLFEISEFILLTVNVKFFYLIKKMLLFFFNYFAVSAKN